MTDKNKELKTRIINETKDIISLSDDWDDLFRRAKEPSPYFSRAWVQIFLTAKDVNGKPLLVTAWSGSKLVALLPLTIHNYFGLKLAKVVPTTILCYTGILLDPDFPNALNAMIESLLHEKIAHVFFNKYTISNDEYTNKFFEELSRHGFTCKSWKRHKSLWTHLEPNFDDVLKSRRTGDQRRWLLRKERRVFKQDDVTVNLYTGKDITQDVLSRIASIQADSWVQEEGKAILGKDFHQELLLEMAQAGDVYIWIMTKGDEDIAFICSFIVDNRIYPKWMSYRQKYGTSSSLSYGTVLYMQMVRYACDNGIRLLDLGFGLDPWKKLWATGNHNIDILISGRGFWGYSVFAVYSILLKCANLRWKLHHK